MLPAIKRVAKRCLFTKQYVVYCEIGHFLCSVISQGEVVALERWGGKWNHLSMTHRLTTNYAKNYCNWTLIVKVIVENVVTCFFRTRCSLLIVWDHDVILRHCRALLQWTTFVVTKRSAYSWAWASQESRSTGAAFLSEVCHTTYGRLFALHFCSLSGLLNDKFFAFIGSSYSGWTCVCAVKRDQLYHTVRRKVVFQHLLVVA